MIKGKCCIVIPCYNEEHALARQEYLDFLKQNPDVMLCFVNDGSSDGTLAVLESIRRVNRENVIVLDYVKNKGKADAVRTGIIHCNENYQYPYIAYLDADLSTSLEECLDHKSYLEKGIVFAFGSRIMKIGSDIQRKHYRFIIGRLVASIISMQLGLKVYDTQCGCKIFTKEISEVVFAEPFISKWLFDVEIFQRLIAFYGRQNALQKMVEIPLKRWIDYGESKVKPTYFFKLWHDLYRIGHRYQGKLITDFSPQVTIAKDL